MAGSLTARAEAAERQVAAMREALEKIREWSSKSLDLVTCASGQWDLNVYQESIRALAALQTSPEPLK